MKQEVPRPVVAIVIIVAVVLAGIFLWSKTGVNQGEASNPKPGGVGMRPPALAKPGEAVPSASSQTSPQGGHEGSEMDTPKPPGASGMR